MFEKRWALSIPFDGFTLEEHPALIREAEQLGYTDAWSFEVDGIDAFVPLAVAAMSSSMRLGTAIANVYTRGPATMAICAAGMAELAPGRFILGIGSGSEPIIELWNDMRFERPATRVKEMVQVVRAALAGEKVTFEGKTMHIQGFRLSRPPKQPVPIQVAALRAGMLTVAGEVGDGAIINWLSVEDVRKSVAVVREAAERAGRDPASIEITARLMVSADPDSEVNDAVLRRAICGYLNVPVYRSFHEWLGRGEVLRPMNEAWDSGDRRGALAAVPGQVVDELMVHGTPEQKREHVLRYMEAGIDTAFLSLFTAEPDPERKKETLLEAMRHMAPLQGGQPVAR
ncbi:MAG: LLM class F420-dependent oxidoreductase [Dehalococcoidia bacterium]